MLDLPTRQKLSWIGVAPDAPYFIADDGTPFTPIGQNDSIAWLELAPLFRRRDLAAVERHLAWLASSGVTVLRLMLECAQGRHRYLERPMGQYVPAMVRLWDDLFEMCERYGLRILLTPYDTFWMYFNWGKHPYARHARHSATPERLLHCPQMRTLIKDRLTFAVTRWGGSGALFAWDLWNEIHYRYSEQSAENWSEFIADLSAHVRTLEHRLYGRSHPQTVSLYGPELEWKPHLRLDEPIFRHPDLDFASIHIYREGTIDDPKDTVAPAIDTGRIVRASLGEISDNRPFLDTEHGPIHRFKDKHVTLPEAFDDEYFRYMQWAHLASGGAGGGMRWPNRHPHCLTQGMRHAQRNLADFTPLIDWANFRRRNLNEEITVSAPNIAGFASADGSQALVWLLRTDTVTPAGTLSRNAQPITTRVTVPSLGPGAYRVDAWCTRTGLVAQLEAVSDGRVLTLDTPPFVTDLALAIRLRR